MANDPTIEEIMYFVAISSCNGHEQNAIEVLCDY